MSDSIPDGVTPGTAGLSQFYSQRIDGKPYVNCMAYSAASQMEFSGVHVPKDFGMRIREASGVPVEPHRGMSAVEVKRGLAVLLPWVTYEAGLLPDTALLGGLAGGQQYHFMLDFAKVPARSKLRRFVGGYQGGHAGWADGARQVGRTWQIHWFDPFAPNGHQGRWLAWNRFTSPVMRSGGFVRVLSAKEGQGLSDFPIPVEVQVAMDGLVQENEELMAQVAALKTENMRLSDGIAKAWVALEEARND
jgi:hypothetical protein